MRQQPALPDGMKVRCRFVEQDDLTGHIHRKKTRDERLPHPRSRQLNGNLTTVHRYNQLKLELIGWVGGNLAELKRWHHTGVRLLKGESRRLCRSTLNKLG